MIALIAEGKTDHAIIKPLLQRIFSRNIKINFRFPDPDKNDKGGWANVLELCASAEFKQLFYSNRWVIIHLDSDVFLGNRVSQKYQGKIKDSDNLQVVVEKIRSIIIENIGRDIYGQFQRNIFFAIAVHETECWLLPYLYHHQKAKQLKTTGCLNAVNQSNLCKNEGIGIDPNNKYVRYYEVIMNKLDRDIKKNPMLYKKNVSAKIFIDSLKNDKNFVREYKDND